MAQGLLTAVPPRGQASGVESTNGVCAEGVCADATAETAANVINRMNFVIYTLPVEKLN